MKFEKISPEISGLIQAAVGENGYGSGDALSADLGHDEKAFYGTSMPEAAVWPTTTGQIAEILRICNENHIPVTPRGAGTGLVGGCVPSVGGLVLSTAKMNKILGYNEESMTVTVQPGVLLSELSENAAAHGYLYAPDPSEKTATVGGNVATNAGGPRALKYGVTRDSVLKATAVLATGEIIVLGSDTIKDNSGYNLLQLVIGSEGTLGVVTEITLRLHPAPKAAISFILPFADMASCIAAAGMIRRSGLEPGALEFMDRDIVAFSSEFTGQPVFPLTSGGEDVAALLLADFTGGGDEELETLMERFAEVAEAAGPLDILVVDTPTLKKDVEAAHDAFHTAIESTAKRCDESNTAVPPEKLTAYMAYARETGENMGLTVRMFGHAGDGNVHIYVYNDEIPPEQFAAKAAAFMGTIYAKCADLGGAVSAEHGIGRGKKSYLQQSAGEVKMRLMRGIKVTFDPNGILNPGKICTDID